MELKLAVSISALLLESFLTPFEAFYCGSATVYAANFV